eukprot:TRINITY_DN3040_c0_g1_i2.p2 TRINITY_DN3040_c0_g1~~TRINITY_DN3040_c0_g1_i2.p2  ORF type:complete len:169 (-),score=47.69 TRINITY_DN3040_c0_g1_i2:113-619(-)
MTLDKNHFHFSITPKGKNKFLITKFKGGNDNTSICSNRIPHDTGKIVSCRINPVLLPNNWLMVGFHQESDWGITSNYPSNKKGKYIHLHNGKVYGYGDTNKDVGWPACGSSENEIVIKIDFTERKLIFELNQSKSSNPIVIPFKENENDWVFSFQAFHPQTGFNIEFF